MQELDTEIVRLVQAGDPNPSLRLQLIAENARLLRARFRLEAHRDHWAEVEEAEEYLGRFVNRYIEHRLACQSGQIVGARAEELLTEYRW